MPVIHDKVYGYQRVNVADQRRDPDSLLNWTERIIRMRKECPEISWGDFCDRCGPTRRRCWRIRYDWRDTSLAHAAQLLESNAQTDASQRRRASTTSCWSTCSTAITAAVTNDGIHRLRLEPYAWRWFRVGAADNTLHLSDLAITDSQVK